jgi:hypothetical protein
VLDLKKRIFLEWNLMSRIVKTVAITLNHRHQ